MSPRPHHPYAVESFTDEESTVLSRHFTSLDRPVFAIINLPEVVKGALFARYSRSPSSIRRLFLDEFADNLGVDAGDPRPVDTRRAEALYDRVFFDYGDDSVAQLGGAHLACEQASNILTKVLEWGRLMAYLEQSTRYIAYNQPLAGRYRYLRPAEILDSRVGGEYVECMDNLFASYASMLDSMQIHLRANIPKSRRTPPVDASDRP